MRRRRIYEGKAKVLFEGPQPGTLVQYFKDETSVPGPPKSLREPPNRPVWHFAAGRPDETRYKKLAL